MVLEKEKTYHDDVLRLILIRHSLDLLFNESFGIV
jgi:hypothetical protein